jgi:hypothetical protein
MGSSVYCLLHQQMPKTCFYLFTSVGSALFSPNRAVTVLCNMTVDISNGNLFCCSVAESVALEEPATCDCTCAGAGAVVVGAVDDSATSEDAEVEDVAASAEAEVDEAEDPAPSTELATIDTVLPAAVGAEAPASPPVVNIAESTFAVLEEVATADGAPAVGLPPATTVICEPAAEACVCIVDGGAPMLPSPLVWSWKGCACGATMGKFPAGHKQAQLHPPAAAAWLLVPLPPGAPA